MKLQYPEVSGKLRSRSWAPLVLLSSRLRVLLRVPPQSSGLRPSGGASASRDQLCVRSWSSCPGPDRPRGSAELAGRLTPQAGVESGMSRCWCSSPGSAVWGRTADMWQSLGLTLLVIVATLLCVLLFMLFGELPNRAGTSGLLLLSLITVTWMWSGGSGSDPDQKRN